MGSRQFWDQDVDDKVVVTVQKETYFIMVAAFACYLY